MSKDTHNWQATGLQPDVMTSYDFQLYTLFLSLKVSLMILNYNIKINNL